jgi:hypothetical protein
MGAQERELHMQHELSIRPLELSELKLVAGGLFDGYMCDFGGGWMSCNYDPDLYVTSGDFARMDRADYYTLTPFRRTTATIGIAG